MRKRLILSLLAVAAVVALRFLTGSSPAQAHGGGGFQFAATGTLPVQLVL